MNQNNINIKNINIIMGLKDIFINSSNETYNQNMELLEEYDLLNPVGNPIKTFMRFLNSKNLNINTDEITDDIMTSTQTKLQMTL